jgi:hypothetical protein
MQLGLPAAEYVPFGHPMHVEGDVAPAANEAFSAWHSSHVADPGSTEYAPAGQGVQLGLPGAEYAPAGHMAQVSLASAPEVLEEVPAGHWLQERVLMAEEKVPMGQAWHAPHEVALYCPAPQFSQR